MTTAVKDTNNNSTPNPIEMGDMEIACLETAINLQASLASPDTDIRLTRFKKAPAPEFTRIWEEEILASLKQGTPPTIETLSSLYQESLNLITQHIEETENQKFSNGSERPMTRAIDALQNMEDKSKAAILNPILADTAKLGLAISNATADIPPNEEHKAHIYDIKKLNDQIKEFPKSPISVVIRTSNLFKTSPVEIQQLIDSKINRIHGKFKPPEETKKLRKFVEEMPCIHKSSLDTVSPYVLQMTTEEKRDAGAWTGIGVAHTDVESAEGRLTKGTPIVGFASQIIATVKTHDNFEFKGKAMILIASPHEELSQDLGKRRVEERVKKTKKYAENLISAIGRTDDVEIITKEELEQEPGFQRLDLDSIPQEIRKKMQSFVGKHQDEAYFRDETNAIIHSKDKKGLVGKISPLKDGMKYDESNFDNYYRAYAEGVLNDTSLTTIGIVAPTTFKNNKQISNYAVSEETAKHCILIEDLEEDDYLKSSINIGNSAAEHKEFVKRFGGMYKSEYCYFASKLACLVSNNGKTQHGRKAVNQLLDIIVAIADEAEDTKLIEGYNKNITGNKIDDTDYDTETVCKFIADKMIHLHENYFTRNAQEKERRGNSEDQNITPIPSGHDNMKKYIGKVNGGSNNRKPSHTLSTIKGATTELLVSVLNTQERQQAIRT